MRRIVGVRGSPHLVVEVEPRFDYGRCRHTVHITDGGAAFESSALRMALTAPVPLRRTLHACVPSSGAALRRAHARGEAGLSGGIRYHLTA